MPRAASLMAYGADATSSAEAKNVIVERGILVRHSPTIAITANQFIEASDQMKKVGAFIPGIRPGNSTTEYLDGVLTRIGFVAAVYLTVIAIFPDLIMGWLNIPPRLSMFFGGTSLLIVVAVTIDTMKQIESHLLQRHYEGFFKTGRLKGRR